MIMIMLVTEDRAFLSEIQTSFFRSEEISMAVARDGDEALHLLKSYSAQLVIMDADMDRRKWGNVIGDLYRMAPEMKVVVLLTGLSKTGIEERDLLRVGADVIVEKREAIKLLPSLITEMLKTEPESF